MFWRRAVLGCTDETGSCSVSGARPSTRVCAQQAREAKAASTRIIVEMMGLVGDDNIDEEVSAILEETGAADPSMVGLPGDPGVPGEPLPTVPPAAATVSTARRGDRAARRRAARRLCQDRAVNWRQDVHCRTVGGGHMLSVDNVQAVGPHEHDFLQADVIEIGKGNGFNLRDARIDGTEQFFGLLMMELKDH